MALNVKHSGHLGDIIYSLSFIKELGQNVNYYIGFEQVNTVYNHPSGKYTMNDASFNYIKPLLEHQDYVDFVMRDRGHNIDLDLDSFRGHGFKLDGYDLRKWYELIYPLTSVDLSKPAIKCDLPTLEYLKEKIVLSISTRYRNNQIDYKRLKPFEDSIVFVGHENEYIDFMLKSKLDIKRVNVKDALHMAQIIKSCKLFIGNQSSSYAIAEQLKTPRLLELYNQAPNVITVNNGTAYVNTDTLINKIQNI